MIEEVQSTIESRRGGYHECYLKIFKLIRKRDKELGRTFDDPRRSGALFSLLDLKRQKLLTEQELMRLSEETREAIEEIDNIFRR